MADAQARILRTRFDPGACSSPERERLPEVLRMDVCGSKPMGVAIGVAAAVASGTGMAQFPSLGELWAVLLAFSAFYVVCATEAAQ